MLDCRPPFVNLQPPNGSASDLVDISPSEFVDIVLPVYKAMSPMAGATGMSNEELITMLKSPNHYTSVSFVRLLALAGRRLRLCPAHFKTVLDSIMDDSGMIMASNWSQEQVRKSEAPAQVYACLAEPPFVHQVQQNVFAIFSFGGEDVWQYGRRPRVTAASFAAAPLPPQSV